MTRDERIIAYIPLVHRIAKKVSRIFHAESLEDIIGDGYVALVELADEFDESRDILFGTFATYRIYQKMLNAIRNRDRNRGRLYHARRRMKQHPNKATEQTIAAFSRETLSLNEQIAHSTASSYPDPAETVVATETRRELATAIQNLPMREASLIADVYGKRRTAAQVGREQGISQQRASQIHRKAIGRLQKALSADPRG